MPDPGDSSRSAAGDEGASDWLSLEIVDDEVDWSSFGAARELAAAAGAALARHPRLAASEAAFACIALSNDATVRELNERYRGKDTATNVLSFPSPAEGAHNLSDVRNLGDVVLARETVAAEASEQALPPAHHLQHLVVHGLLHLMGFDHMTEAEALEMEGLEIEILASMGIGNPYLETAASEAGGEPVRRLG